ncbi:FAD-binding oxidoreductase [Pseudonocardia sp. HH130630-07]|uniref:FAD-binding oxidoreductase n=1 Tax=Pseudonocardia sp. HH130630-07 TaxID=1690815 RepID=UPI0012EA8FB2|nr:FAD-binding oxidoreductase [Pseudonocardia sp. HH130630-07]
MQTDRPSALERFRGTLVRPQDADYERLRHVWNRTVDRRPALIARCVCPEDVAIAVAHARQHGLPLAVRAGGHSVAGHSTCDDGVVVDLSMMSAVDVDPQARHARVEGGALLGAFDAATQAHLLAAPAGVVAHTGLGGLVLGGGFGWLSRKHGLAIDNLTAVDVVTADGRQMRADTEHHPDLFWALRGGGGNFGVATAFEFDLHHVGAVRFAVAYHPLDDGPRVLRDWAAYMSQAPDELTWVFYLRLAPPVPDVPKHLHGKPVLCGSACWIGDVSEGDLALEAVRDVGRPAAVATTTLPYRSLQGYSFPSPVLPDRAYFKSGYLDRLPDAAIDALLAAGASMTSPMSQLEVLYLGGAISRVPADATAFGHRTSPFVANFASAWRDPAHDSRHVAWAVDSHAALEPHMTGGGYVNFFNESEGHRTVDAFGADNLRRLRRIKADYDPDNTFRLNTNIVPGEG